MPWHITCTDETCDENTGAAEIDDLLAHHTDADGWFRCACGQPGYIEKSFELQEGGDPWSPYLRGAIRLADTPQDTYQPFVFLVSDTPDGPAESVWFSYYKDLRKQGGRLKLGYGPGGPPVMRIERVNDLLEALERMGRSPA